MRKVLVSIALCVLLCCSCTRGSGGKYGKYMVSIEPQRWLLEQLVDSGVQVDVLLSRGSDPETVELTMTQRVAADDAEAYFATGLLPFEERVRESVRGLYYDTSDSVALIYGTHDHAAGSDDGHAHSHAEAPDPHVWTSPRRMAAAAHSMARGLEDTGSGSIVAARLARLEARLDSMDAAVAQAVAASGVTSFAVWHPFLSYYAADYGLRQIVVGQEGKEMSARQIKDAVDVARADSVKVLFVERSNDPRQASIIAEGIGARLVVVDPLAYDFEQQMTLITNELTRP